jgi:AcrR family transcriptional regulator
VEQNLIDGNQAKANELQSLSTRDALMLVGERLFGDLGIDAVPLRAIAKEAGQKNTNSVQYHFGSRIGLVHAIFEYRETQLNPLRNAMLSQRRAWKKKESDVRWLLRIMYEPYFLHYRDNNGLSYLKLHAQYLTSLRPRGVAHPIDEEIPAAAGLRKTIQLLRDRLPFLDKHLFNERLESCGAMFLSAMIQHSARPPNRRLPVGFVFEDVLEMITSAYCTKPPPLLEPVLDDECTLST